MADLHKLLTLMVNKGAFDLHLTCGSPPHLRIDGHLIPLRSSPLTPEDTKRLCYSFLTDKQRPSLKGAGTGLELRREGCRFRVNLFR